MSGSGGTVYDPEPPRVTCDKLTFLTVLNSPVPAVIRKLKKGEVLAVVVEKRGDAQYVVAKLGADIAGAITSDFLPQLLDCLLGGTEYEAHVLDAISGKVDVRIQKKR